MRAIRLAVFCLLVTLAAAPGLWAQTQITSGVIQGVVQDETGAVMPGATVTVRNLDTNLEQTAETNERGRFVFLQLRSGPYTLRASKQGFTTIIHERMPLTVGQTIPLTLTLRVSPVAEEIIVTGSPTIDIVKTESSSTLNQMSIENTPVLGRKFEDLFTLTPGVSIVQGPDGDEITFNGQRGIFNNISLDGGDYNNSFFGEQVGGQRAQIDITMDAIKEFQVIATGGSAEFGRTAGGIVNVITKSGTNEVHGSAFYFQRLEDLSANDSQGNPLTDFEREQFGGTIGGPIVQDKAFFFVAFEQIFEELTRPNLSAPLGTCSVTAPNILTDEAAIGTEPECQRLALLDFFQTTRGQDEGQPVAFDAEAFSLLGKFDANLSAGNQLSSSYSLNRSENVNATFDVPTYGNSANGIEGTPSWIQTFNLNLFSTVSSNMFNEAHFTYSREKRPRATVESNVPADTGIGFAPSFRFGNPFFLQPAVDELFWKTQIRDNFSIIAGTHTVKFGGEWIHSQNSQVFRGFFTGRFIFDSVPGFLRFAGDRAVSGDGFGPTTANCADGTFTDTSSLVRDFGADGIPGTGDDTLFCDAAMTNEFGGGPLLLYLQDAGTGLPGVPLPGVSSIDNEEFALFIQDKWQIRPNFTLSYGLRWDAQYMPDTVDPTNTAFGQFLNSSIPHVLGIGFPSDGTIPDQTDMIQPRVAIAWDVANNQKSVLRASWGIYNARQNMLTQVGSVTTNGLQQQTIFRDTALIQLLNFFGLPASEVVPTWPGVTTPASLTPGTFPDFSGVRVFSKDYENPRIYTGNIAFEQEIYPDWAMYVDFTLSNGTRLTRFININRADRGGPFGPALGDVFVAASIGQSTYLGATIGMRKKFSKGYQLEWNYTWSQDEDDDSNERDPFVDRSNTVDPLDLSLNFGNSDRDIKHKFNFITSAELPGSFNLNVRIQARSAQPITDPNRESIFASTGVDVGRNSLRKDTKFFSLDWRLSRPFKFGERYAITPIFEMFNSFDNTNNINPLISPALFNFDGFLRQGVGDPMQVQLAVKFTF